MYEDDLEELLRLGVSMEFKFSNGNVWAQSGSRRLSIARLICDAGVGQKVLFVDRDPFNMKRENLVISKGLGKYRTRDQLDFTVHRLRKDVIIEHDVR
jgi:hypothetical protein